MKIKNLTLGPLEANCYIVERDGEVCVIDPGYPSAQINDIAAEYGEKIKYILLTHCHCDHISGAEKLRKLTSAKLGIYCLDAEGYISDKYSLSELMEGIYPSVRNNNAPDFLIRDGDELSFGNGTIFCIHTPGHTLGGCSYYFGDVLFSGDTLFKGSIGRTDYYGGSYYELVRSLKKLIALSDGKNYTVYPGHGEPTDILTEQKYNPHMVNL